MKSPDPLRPQRKHVRDVTDAMTYQTVTLRGRVHAVRGKGKSAFLVLRQQLRRPSLVFFVDDVNVSKGMVKWVSTSPRNPSWTSPVS